MERKKVRIYKAPNGQGEYINKTSQFLKKAQMGAETRSDEVMQQKQIEALKQYVVGALDNQMEPEEVYKLLISKGIPKEVAYPILTQVMQEMEAPEEEEQPETKEGSAEESKIGQSEFQPVGQENQETEEEDAASDGMNYYNSYADEEDSNVIANSEEEYQIGGPITYDQLSASEGEEEDASYDLNDRLASLEDFISKTEEDDFSDFGKDISEYKGDYTPIEWDTLGDGYGYYKKGGSKKNFTKNVLALIKKQEGGDAAESNEIGKGNKKDTLTNEVSKIKSSFTDKLKEVSSKAAIDSIYEKMMKSNDPELMQSAQELAQNRQKSSQMGSFEPIAQQGGYVGEEQPDMFSQGGFDMPEAQKGIIQRLGDTLLGEKYTTANNPYTVKTGALYKDPLTGLTPVARTVHKRGILGRPKKYTDYYTKSSKVDQDFINNFSEGKPKADTKKSEDIKVDLKKREYNIPDEQYEKLSRRDKRQERKWAKLENETKEFNKGVNFVNVDEEERKQKEKELKAAMKDAAAWSTKIGMDTPEWWDNGTTEAALPEGLSDEDIEMINASNAEKENMLNSPATEKQRVLETYLNPDSPLLLNNSNEEDFIDNWYMPTLKNAVQNREEFTPSSSMDDPGLNPYYRFATGKSKATTKKEAEEEAMRMQMEKEGREAEYEKRYGGLLKAQLGPTVKSGTSGLNPASDPTANSGNLVGMLKPQNNPNSFMGASAPFMNQNVPVNKDAKVDAIQMDPNQIKDQKITSLDFKDDDSLIAQDVTVGRNFDPEQTLLAANSRINALSSFLEKRQDAKQPKNTFTADEVYSASTNKDRGDYVAYGQQTGMFRPDETGQQTSGRFAYGQYGGYMQEGGYTEGDEVDMTEEELAEFIANGGEVEYL
jgi:hypothetical protein